MSAGGFPCGHPRSKRNTLVYGMGGGRPGRRCRRCHREYMRGYMRELRDVLRQKRR